MPNLDENGGLDQGFLHVRSLIAARPPRYLACLLTTQYYSGNRRLTSAFQLVLAAAHPLVLASSAQLAPTVLLAAVD